MSDGEFKQENPEPHLNPPTTTKFPISFRHLYTLAIAAVLAATNMVTLSDISFVFFSLTYIHILSKFSFPVLSSKHPPVFSPNKILPLYVSFAAIIGLLLPIIYIAACVYAEKEGHRVGAEAASPHLFLLASQVFMEGVAFSGRFSLPVRVFVPVFYNSRRIFSIVDWMRAEFLEESGGGSRLGWFGRGLAVANMGLWCFNLFAFLLPVYLPRAFKIYYSSSNNKGV